MMIEALHLIFNSLNWCSSGRKLRGIFVPVLSGFAPPPPGAFFSNTVLRAYPLEARATLAITQ